jgi:hypothetical protein
LAPGRAIVAPSRSFSRSRAEAAGGDPGSDGGETGGKETVRGAQAVTSITSMSSEIGMHAGYFSGYPASDGCIRLPKQMAVHFFQNATIGTQVAIRRELPHDYAANPLASESYSSLTSIVER